MAELDVAEGLPNLSSLPANPDAQDTVKDFLDYTEFYPSDLVRSLTLINKLDKTYQDLTDEIHRLTKTYASLPQLRADLRPDPQVLRQQISAALDRAILCRESAYAESVRLYDVTERHKHRLSIIKRKLQALPEPPSRDPTPPPVSPQATRSRRQEAERAAPRLTLHVGRQPPQSARAARAEKGRGRAPPSDESESDFSDADGILDSGLRKRKVPVQKIKIPKTPKVRPPGVMGTNVHSSVAGISTSNALAKLTPPPPDAPPGSKYAPWYKLTEYEMALLRKQMKKNAIWVPSDVMIRRELARRGRGHENYLKAKAHAEETGEPFLDEDPHLASAVENGTAAAGGDPAANDGSKIPAKEDTSIINRGMRLNEAKKLKRTRELEEANRQMKETGDFMKTLFSNTRGAGGQQMEKSGPGSSPTNERKRRELMRSVVKKRKRDESPDATRTSPKEGPGSASLAHADSQEEHLPESPAPKKLKIVPPKATAIPLRLSSPVTSPTAVPPAPDSATTVKTTTMQIPLAPPGPAGPTTPTGTSTDSTAAAEESVEKDPIVLISPTDKKKALSNMIAQGQTTTATATTTASSTTSTVTTTTTTVQVASGSNNNLTTAAASRPRRESTAPLKEHEKTPDLVVSQKSPAGVTTAASSRPSRQASSRPVSRAGTNSVPPSVKAASAEPPSQPELLLANGNANGALRRASNASMPMSTTPLLPFGVIDSSGRARRKPAPGAVASDGDGKGKISRVNRRKGQKKKDGTPFGPGGEGEIDANEPRYCVCNDVSYGEMIACDNKSCEGEWFHYSCVGIPEGTLPSRVAKWYCPPCRKIHKIDENGNPEILNLSVDRIKRPSR